ncbi:MAG: RHS repeat-associated core domain-containing protein [Anaerolineae bacterium]|nr:RHS repeat-associated core domain-containing protein [Anaerolineae bacterium]
MARQDPTGLTVNVGAVEVEISGAQRLTTTYYFAGGQRIAMRKDGKITYLHGDHLGSASLATDASGAKVSEMRYTPFGEVRFGDVPTDRRFTGQREEAGIGLYDYGARFYSSGLGRFISADVIIPGAGNSQAFNRYSYVLNNPLKFSDPSGHDPIPGAYADGYFRGRAPSPRLPIKFVGDWGGKASSIRNGVYQVAKQLANTINMDQTKALKRAALTGEDPASFTSPLTPLWGATPVEAFGAVYGQVTFRFSSDVTKGWGWTRIASLGEIWYNSSVLKGKSFNVMLNAIHELGHGLAQLTGSRPYNELAKARIYDNSGTQIAGSGWPELNYCLRTNQGYYFEDGSSFPWQQHHLRKPIPGVAEPCNEDFADMYLGWTMSNFAYDGGAGPARYQWMNGHMVHWIVLAMNRNR